MTLSERLLTLFGGRVGQRRGSYVIEIPESELRHGDVDPGDAYRVALYASPTGAEADADPASEGPRSDGSAPDRRRPTEEPTPPAAEGEVLAVEIEDVGEVIGVIPDALTAVENPPSNLTELRTVGSMHDRKRTTFELAEGFVALPGGRGTIDELFEMFTWAQLGIHHYPCGILNVSGYDDGLRGCLDRAVDEGFLPEDHRQLLVVDDDPAALLNAFATYDAPPPDETLDLGET